MSKLLIIITISAALLLFALRFGFGFGITDSIRFFDVGQGDSSLVSCGRAQMLIDGGPDRIVLNRLGAAMPFFDRRIEYFLLSHPHDDHLFGAFAILERYEVGQVLISEFAAEEWRGRDFISFAEERGVEVIEVKAGDAVELCPGMRLEIIWPFSSSDTTVSGGRDRTNDLSVVGRLVSNHQFDAKICTLFWGAVLFTGDITSTAERAILDSGVDISACVLKVPHHGSRYSSSPEFIRAVAPSQSVISVGENRYGQPSAVTVFRLGAAGSAIHRTDIDGGLSVAQP